MITRSLVLAALGPRGAKAADAKRRGGDSNGDGARFEEDFAAARIVTLAIAESLAPARMKTISLASQVYGFVDDMFVQIDALQIYYELKSSRSQTWRCGLKKSFYRQRKVIEFHGLSARSVLIASSRDRAVALHRNRPGWLDDVRVGCFASSREDVLEQMRSVSGPNDDYMSVRGLFYCLVGLWTHNNSIRALDVIWEDWQGTTRGGIRSVSIKMADELIRNLLNSIVDMTFEFDSGPIVTYTREDDTQGHIAYPVGSPQWIRLSADLLVSMPTCFLDFYDDYVAFCEEEEANED